MLRVFRARVQYISILHLINPWSNLLSAPRRLLDPTEASYLLYCVAKNYGSRLVIGSSQSWKISPFELCEMLRTCSQSWCLCFRFNSLYLGGASIGFSCTSGALPEHSASCRADLSGVCVPSAKYPFSCDQISHNILHSCDLFSSVPSPWSTIRRNEDLQGNRYPRHFSAMSS